MFSTLNSKLRTAKHLLPFLTTTNRANEYKYLSLELIVFPTLFLFGTKNTSNRDRSPSISLTKLNKHLFKHYFLD